MRWDLADLAVLRIGDEDVTFGIDADALWIIQPRARRRGTYDDGKLPGLHLPAEMVTACCRKLENRVVRGIGDEKVP